MQGTWVGISSVNEEYPVPSRTAPATIIFNEHIKKTGRKLGHVSRFYATFSTLMLGSTSGLKTGK
jgi:hypothetical protein